MMTNIFMNFWEFLYPFHLELLMFNKIALRLVMLLFFSLS